MNLLYILLFWIQLEKEFSYIILPFHFSKNNSNNKYKAPINYFDYYMNNKIFSKIKISDKLFINFRLTMEKYIMCISNKIYNKYSENNISDNIYSLNYLNIKKALLINDSFNFEIAEINNKYIKTNNVNNISFFLVTKYSNKMKSIENGEIGEIGGIGEIGLNRVKGNQFMDIEKGKDLKSYLIEDKANLIFQLKKMNLINSTIFSIKYNKDDEGELIIGDFPHIYDPINYSENNLFMNKVTIFTCPPYNWYSRFSELIYNNESLIIPKLFYFSIDHGFIEAPLSVKHYFKSFFDKYNNSCKEDRINNYFVFYCEKDVINNFNSISFTFQAQQSYQNGHLNNLKMEFNYQDLFLKDKNSNNKIYYFQIIFKNNNDWIFGKPVFKKYRIIFDQDKKMYGIYNYINYINNHNEDIYNEKKEQSKKSKNNTLTIFILLLVILISVISIESYLLLKKMLNKPRNKRANELKDDYEYDNYLNLEQDTYVINS